MTQTYPSLGAEPERLTAARALAAVLDSAAAGRFPPADGTVVVLPQPSDRDAGVIALTGHAVVFADSDPGWVAGQLPQDDLSAPLSATFLQALGERLGRRSHSVDMLTCADSLPGPAPEGPDLTEIETAEIETTGMETAGPVHPRLARALRYRDEVRAFETAGGLLTLGRGVAGRWEVSVEVDQLSRGRGLGAALATAARHLVWAGEPLWAQIAPGNAASVRAFLRAGFRPVGAEALLTPNLDGGMTDAVVTDNQAESRLEIHANGEVAELVYRERAGRLVLIHTGVPEALSGRGLGSQLVQAALAKAAREGLTVVPLCPYARSWLERHPDEAAKVSIDWTE